MSTVEKTASTILERCKQGSYVSPETIIRSLLLSEDSFATVLFLIVMDQYGQEALEWAPETIRMELEQDFHLSLPRISLDKIMAAIGIVTTNYFYKDLPKFIQICNILSGDDFDPTEFDPADSSEIMQGVTEAILLWPPEDTPEESFSEEIQEYVRQVLQTEGVITPLSVLDWVTKGAQNIDSSWADDPEMYSAIYDSQQGKKSELEEEYYDNMQELKMQLKILPLKTGSKEGLVESIEKILNVLKR